MKRLSTLALVMFALKLFAPTYQNYYVTNPNPTLSPSALSMPSIPFTGTVSASSFTGSGNGFTNLVLWTGSGLGRTTIKYPYSLSIASNPYFLQSDGTNTFLLDTSKFVASYVDGTLTNLVQNSGSNYFSSLGVGTLSTTNLVGDGSGLTNAAGATSPYQFVTLAQQQAALAVYRAFYLWSGSNSTVNTNAKAMRTLDYGAAPLGTNTVTIYSNAQYVTYCSPAAGITELKAGTYQVTADIWQSAAGADAVSLAAEIYVFHPGTYTETEITPVAGTSSQVITGSKLQYIFTLTVSTNVTIAATDSIELKFKTSGTAGTPVTLYIESGALQVPTPASQYPLLSGNNTFTAQNTFAGVNATGITNNGATVAQLYSTKSAFTFQPTNTVVVADVTNLLITLPNCTNNAVGRVVSVIAACGAQGAVVVTNANGVQQLAQSASVTLYTNQSLTLVNDGSNWR